MKQIIVDTNVVSILVRTGHPLRESCLRAVSGREMAISFMSLAELLAWPVRNHWGEARRAALLEHLSLYEILYPTEVNMPALGGDHFALPALGPSDRAVGRMDHGVRA